MFSLTYKVDVTETDWMNYLRQGYDDLDSILTSTRPIGQQFYQGNHVWNRRMLKEEDVLNELQAKEKLATLLGKAGTFEVDGVSRDGIEESRKLWTDLFERTRLSLVLTRQPNELSVPARTGVLRAARLRVVRSLDAAAASQHVARPFAGANAASPRLPRRSLREAADLSAAPLRAVALARRGGIRSAVQRDDR